MYSTRLRNLSIATTIVLVGTFALAFFSAPMDADQGFSQKIFYVHVPLAIVTLGGFVYGGIMGLQHLRTRNPRYDLKSYVGIHLSLIFACGVLITGAIWAKAAWGVWWEWREPTLVAYLIVFLLYCCYQPLRFAIEDPDLQARVASVFSVVAGAFVPLCFLAIRLATPYIHPRVLNEAGSDLPAGMKAPFYLAIVGMILLFTTLWTYEMTHKNARAQLRSLRRKLGGDAGAGGRSAAPQLELQQ
jgi:heme exporter protein C